MSASPDSRVNKGEFHCSLIHALVSRDSSHQQWMKAFPFALCNSCATLCASLERKQKNDCISKERHLQNQVGIPTSETWGMFNNGKIVVCVEDDGACWETTRTQRNSRINFYSWTLEMMGWRSHREGLSDSELVRSIMHHHVRLLSASQHGSPDTLLNLDLN